MPLSIAQTIKCSCYLALLPFFMAYPNSLQASELGLKPARIQEDDQELFAKFHKKMLFPISITNRGEGPIYLFLTRGGSVGRFDVNNNEFIGSVSLTRADVDYLPPQVVHRYKDHGYLGAGQAGKFLPPLGAYTQAPLGCLTQRPLRYGDVHGGDRNDLVLWLGYDFVIFSPEQEETLFSQRISVADWLSREKTADFLEFVPGGAQSDKPHYQSRIIAQTSANYQSAAPGYRGYAKLYFGSFSAPDSRDILMWHKLYESLRESDDLKGFKKLSDVYRHVVMKTDGAGKVKYVLADTAPDVIRGWLSASDLTWQDGFPSKSECPGHEDELIPEMHDPLLNDPDVLK